MRVKIEVKSYSKYKALEEDGITQEINAILEQLGENFISLKVSSMEEVIVYTILYKDED